MARLLPEKPTAGPKLYVPPPETPELLAAIRSQIWIGYLFAALFALCAAGLCVAAWAVCGPLGCMERTPEIAAGLCAALVGLAIPTVWVVARPIQTSLARPFSWMFALLYMWLIFGLFPVVGVVIALVMATVHGRGRYGAMDQRRGEDGPITASYPAVALEHGEGGPTAAFFVALAIVAPTLEWALLRPL